MAASPGTDTVRRVLSLKVRLLGSVAAVGVTASVAGLGTYGTFTSSTPSTSTPVTAGTVSIALGAVNTAANRLTLAATGLVPGDTVQRAFQLVNNGNQALSGITLTTTASPSSLLDTDVTNGLQLVLDRCSVPWTETGTSPAFSYSCSGTTTSVLATRPVIGANLALTNLASTSPAVTDHLRATLTFPTAAPNTFQGLTSTVTYVFTGNQRAATNG